MTLLTGTLQILAATEVTQSRRREMLGEIANELESLQSRNVDLDQERIWKVKLGVCEKYAVARVPKNSEILEFLSPQLRAALVSKLRRKGVRTKSGVAVVTAITKPFDCPHGTCTFCPGGVRFGTPQSYTKESPATSFGISRGFDPARQVSDSIRILENNGHDTSKVELILLGGTILAMPLDYQVDYVKGSYDALNGTISASLSESISRNEWASHRCVGLTIETKPDWCRKEHIDLLLSFGATRVEIGVQSLREEVLRATNRGHTLGDTYDAFGVAKDAAFKIVAHMMPGLPLSDPDKDLEDLLSLVEDDRLKPDMLKIYPTLVVEGTPLYRQYIRGRYTPYDLEEIVRILARFKRQVPPWLRIMRIQREIPKHEITGGARAGNLRQLVHEEMRRNGDVCRCIRCREVGRRAIHASSSSRRRDPRLKRLDYESSNGHEVFLSFEEKELGDDDSEILHGFLRLRIPSGGEHRAELCGRDCSLVRELHVYGTAVPIGARSAEEAQSQHRGFGSELLRISEEIARDEFKRSKHVVISASGTREYYRKRGYRDDGVYVSKTLE